MMDKINLYFALGCGPCMEINSQSMFSAASVRESETDYPAIVVNVHMHGNHHAQRSGPAGGFLATEAVRTFTACS